tara:strand:- start:671 stop:859 length:189 start_codon:yes stop_codon:yes gene_type:complete
MEMRSEINRLVSIEKEREQNIAEVFPGMAMKLSDEDIYLEVEAKVLEKFMGEVNKDLGDMFG